MIFSMLGHNFMGNGIVMTVIPVLDVLFRKGALCRLLVSNNRVR